MKFLKALLRFYRAVTLGNIFSDFPLQYGFFRCLLCHREYLCKLSTWRCDFFAILSLPELCSVVTGAVTGFILDPVYQIIEKRIYYEKNTFTYYFYCSFILFLLGKIYFPQLFCYGYLYFCGCKKRRLRGDD